MTDIFGFKTVVSDVMPIITYWIRPCTITTEKCMECTKDAAFVLCSYENRSLLTKQRTNQEVESLLWQKSRAEQMGGIFHESIKTSVCLKHLQLILTCLPFHLFDKTVAATYFIPFQILRIQPIADIVVFRLSNNSEFLYFIALPGHCNTIQIVQNTIQCLMIKK